MRSVAAISAGLAHAALMLLAFPPINLWPAALVAIVPLAWAAARLGSGKAVMRKGAASLAPATPSRFWLPALLIAAGVLPFYIYQLHWLIPVTAVGYIPMAIGMSLFSSAFVWTIAMLMRRLPRLPLTLTVPIVWTALEVFRGEVAFTGYPWFLLAHPLIDAPVLPLPAAVLGTYFVSFLVAMLTGAAADIAFRQPRHRAPALEGAAFAVLAWAGSALVPQPDSAGAPTLRVAVVQTNLPQDNKLTWTIEQKIQDFERFLDLTSLAAASRPDVIIWPETMFPEALDPQAVHEQRRVGLVYQVDPRIRVGGRIFATEFHDRIVELHQDSGIPMLIGVVGLDNLRLDLDRAGRVMASVDAVYNSVRKLSGGGVTADRYDKLKLTPFGEVMPYLHAWPWLERQLMAIGARGMSFDLHAGREPRTFDLPASDGTMVAVATPICFEVTKPRLAHLLLRDVPRGKPRLLVNVTNDGWFTTFDGARRQHLQIARWRSLELGVPMIRAANTGISASIDARGRVVKSGTDEGRQSRADGVLTADVRLTAGGTVYSLTGEIFGWLVLAACSVLGVAAAARRGIHDRGM